MINYAKMFKDEVLPEPEIFYSTEKVTDVLHSLTDVFRLNAGVYGCQVSIVSYSEISKSSESFIVSQYMFDDLAEKLLRIRKPDIIFIAKEIEPIFSDEPGEEFKYIIHIKTVHHGEDNGK